MKKRMRFKIAATLLFLFFISSPTHAVPDSLVGLRNTYQKVVDRNTRRAEIYGIRDLDAHYIVYATFQSADFRQGYTEHYDKLYPRGQDGLANELGHPWDGRPAQAEFFIAVYAKAKGLKKMTGPKNLWDISLKVEGQYYKPASVEEVSLTPFEYKFYPFLDPWSRAYRVKFPVPLQQAENSGVSLELASVSGKSELKFK